MRVKRGTSKRQSHKKVLKSTKGYRQSYSKLYRRAREAALHAGQYSFAHRRARRAQMRRQWITTISAGLTSTGVSYKDFMHGMNQKGIKLNRKMLAELATDNPDTFAEVVKTAVS